MELYKRVDVLHNKRLLISLNILALLVLLVAVPLFLGYTLLFNRNHSFVISSDNILAFIFLPFMLLLLLIMFHELIHGLFFKVFSAGSKVKFGYQNFMFYASSVGNRYTRRQMLIVGLAPFVIITALLLFLYAAGWMPGHYFVILASIHASACSGDFYYGYLLLRAPKNCVVEDTEVGIDIYVPGD